MRIRYAHFERLAQPRVADLSTATKRPLVQHVAQGF